MQTYHELVLWSIFYLTLYRVIVLGVKPVYISPF